MSAVLKHIAAVAKGLNKGELHVLIELASRGESAGGHDAMASSRDLAEQTGLARSSVQLALDALHRKGLIHSNAGSSTRSTLHRMLFLDAVEADSGGPNFMPEVARKSGQSGPKFEPGFDPVA
jgi:DNA-binding transcriptional MocR family regulator